MTALYFRHTKTGKKYHIVKLDKDRNVITLRGEIAEFEQPYDKAQFQQLGYVLERSEDPTPTGD